MSIIIFGDLFSFPEGQAATSRIYTYAKGFIEKGIKVHVVCFSNNYMSEPNGSVNGINYYNPFGQKERSRYFIVRRWHKLMKYKRTYSVLKKINRTDRIVVINRWSDTFITKFYAWALAWKFKTKIITECNEHPLRNYQGGYLNRKIGLFHFYMDCYFSHGILCISRYLIELHIKKGIKKEKLFLVPSTVDPSRFKKNGQKPLSHPYIGYFGSLTFERDNLDLLIKAFARISKQHSQYKLVLGGFCNEKEKRDMLNLVESLEIQPKVLILDFLTRSEIAQYISHADILVVVRSKDLESDASYPSKLTEFLATGNPVVSVNVGEVSDFLEDGVNAFLINPGDTDALIKKIHFIIENYDSTTLIGREGKKLTETVFNYSYQANRIVEFVHSLN